MSHDLCLRAVKRFWKRVNKTDDACWLWAGAHSRSGYGTLRMRWKTVRVHRFSWVLHELGPIGDKYVCHKCDTPLCVRPDHLFLGTAADNLRDAIQKARFPGRRDHRLAAISVKAAFDRRRQAGFLPNNAKLDDDKVRQIRAMKQTERVSNGELGRRFGVVRETIRRVLTGVGWKDVA